MGVIGIIGKVIAFPFKFIFGGGRKKNDPDMKTEDATIQKTNYTYPPEQTYPEPTPDNLKAKVDLMLAQMDGLKLEYDAMSQRIQNIERMVKELYAMSKS